MAAERRLPIALAGQRIRPPGRGTRDVIEDRVVTRRTRGRLPVKRQAYGLAGPRAASLDVKADQRDAAIEASWRIEHGVLADGRPGQPVEQEAAVPARLSDRQLQPGGGVQRGKAALLLAVRRVGERVI